MDDDLPTSRTFLRRYKESRSLPVDPGAVPRLPMGCAPAGEVSRWSEGQLPPTFNRRRCARRLHGNTYSNEKVKRAGLDAACAHDDALQRYFDFVRSKATAVIKVAIVGCGKIADAARVADQSASRDGQRSSPSCDQEPLMARQLADRFAVPRHFTSDRGDAGRAPSRRRPHHHAAGRATSTRHGHCLVAGCHVYVEKPFTLTTKEAEELLASPTKKGLKLTAGHNGQFSHRRCACGSSPTRLSRRPSGAHGELYCYDLSKPTYAQAMLGNKQHWVRKLPG